MDRFYSLSHSSIDFHFRQTPRDFVVEEIPLYEFCGDGEHLVLFIRKKELSTLELVSIIAKYLGIQNKEIGYAGLKDKHAMTKQYISLHKKYEEKMDDFKHEDIKILSKIYHNNKIRIGHLSGHKCPDGQISDWRLDLVRITAFMAAAPFFKHSAIPNILKVVFSILLTSVITTAYWQEQPFIEYHLWYLPILAM